MTDKLTVEEMVHLMKEFSYGDQLTIMFRSNRFFTDDFSRYLQTDRKARETEAYKQISSQSRYFTMQYYPGLNIVAVAETHSRNCGFIGWMWRYIINERIRGRDVPDLHVEIAKCLRSGAPDLIGLGRLMTVFPDPADWEIAPYVDRYLSALRCPAGTPFANEAELQAFERDSCPYLTNSPYLAELEETQPPNPGRWTPETIDE